MGRLVSSPDRLLAGGNVVTDDISFRPVAMSFTTHDANGLADKLDSLELTRGEAVLLAAILK